jgi:hypothetical protein
MHSMTSGLWLAYMPVAAAFPQSELLSSDASSVMHHVA